MSKSAKKQANEVCSRFVALKTIEGAIKKKLEQLKPEVEDIMRDAFDEEGTDRKRVRLNGTTIGTITACTSSNDFAVTNADKFIEWLEDYGKGTFEPKVNAKASREIWNMLEAKYDESDFRHLFFIEPKPSRETLKNIFCVEDVCLYEGIPMVIPGIKPKEKDFKFLRVTDTHLPSCLSALNSKDGEGLAGLLEAN